MKQNFLEELSPVLSKASVITVLGKSLKEIRSLNLGWVEPFLESLEKTTARMKAVIDGARESVGGGGLLSPCVSWPKYFPVYLRSVRTGSA
jgi:hypothetical protein